MATNAVDVEKELFDVEKEISTLSSRIDCLEKLFNHDESAESAKPRLFIKQATLPCGIGGHDSEAHVLTCVASSRDEADALFLELFEKRTHAFSKHKDYGEWRKLFIDGDVMEPISSCVLDRRPISNLEDLEFFLEDNIYDPDDYSDDEYIVFNKKNFIANLLKKQAFLPFIFLPFIFSSETFYQ